MRMGQAESLSKFEDNEHLTEMDGKLLTYRKRLMMLVHNNEDTSQGIISLIGLPVPISMKYACLDVKQIFSLNNKTVAELKKIPLALGILEKYGRHLLKPVHARAEMWRSVKFSNPIYKERVNPLKGSSEIMKLMGYTIIVDDGVYFPENQQPDPNHTLNLVCDLIIAKTEMELYLSGKHPQASDIEQFLPENTVSNINDILHGTTKPNPPTLNLQRNIVREEPDAIEKTCEDISAESMCEICLCQKAEVYCEDCDNKIFCKTCDVKWHRHPKRQDHETKRKKFDRNFVTQAQPRITHQGAYGVSEVIQKKTNPLGLPVNPQQATYLESIKKESDTDPSIKSRPQSFVNNSENIEDQLRRHHLKIKSYSEQSTKYQPVKFLASSPKSDSNFSRNSISYPPELKESPVPSASPILPLNISPTVTRSESITSTSQRKSKMLSKIMLLPDINLRKSKCELNIIAAEEEIAEVDEGLDKILSEDEQFLQNEDFVSLTRKKSVLIREKKSLTEYLKELDSITEVSSILSHSESTVKEEKALPVKQIPKAEKFIDDDVYKDNWICDFCTFLNSHQNRVCCMCHKTHVSSANEIYKATDKPEAMITEPKPMEVENGGTKSEPKVVLENVGNKFNDLQDQVYLEKKAAQSLYNDQEQSPAASRLTNLVQATNNSSIPSTTEKDSSALKSDTDNIVKENSPTLRHTDWPREFNIPSEYYEFPKKDKRDSVATASFQEIMKVNSEIKIQNEIKTNGLKLFKIVKKADELGYDVEAVAVALAQLDDDSLQVIEWLDENWQQFIDNVFEKIRSSSRNMVNNTIGELSIPEVEKALKKSKGNIEEAAQECVKWRQDLYIKFNSDERIPREDVLYTMFECHGDTEEIENTLNQIALQPFLERIWEGVDIHEYSELCNSVSNSIIERDSFQETVKNSNLDKERRTRMVFMEGNLKSWGRAETVIKIVDEELNKSNLEMSTLEDVIEAVRNCDGFKTALAYLQQECEICLAAFPMNKITGLNICQCKLCNECIKLHFEHCVKDMNVRKWSCPVCSRPNMADHETAQNYLSFLSILIRSYCDEPTQDLFDKKANLWNIQQDANFRWCAHCETGFIFHGQAHQLCMTCDNCSKKTCFKCKKQWEAQHEGITCEEFEQWKYDNDPSNQALALANHLAENGIDCPSCKMRYSLSKGGCMHFTCPQCSHEFCSGCCQPFYHENTCPLSCVGKGLHCHHPRDCFFYLRDEDPITLQELLQKHQKGFDKDVTEASDVCPVMEQKERVHSSNYDEACGKEVKDGWAGLCIDHYKEYLVGLINKHNLDPLDVIQVEDRLKIILIRLKVNDVKKKQNERQADFIARLKKTIKEKEPLKKHN